MSRVQTVEQKHRAKEMQKTRDARRSPESRARHSSLRRERKFAWSEERREQERLRYRNRRASLSEDEKRKESLYQKEYRCEHKTEVDSYQRQYQLEHGKEKATDQRRRRAAWTPERRERENKWRREYYQRQVEVNPPFLLRKRLRTLIFLAVRGKKLVSSQQLLGCTIDEMRNYLELMFWPGMGWSNYGEWHIDHVIPLSRFDLEIVEQQMRAFHYANLQPLWADDNILKGNSLGWTPKESVHQLPQRLLGGKQ